MLFLRRRREQRRSFPRWRAGRRIFCSVLFLFHLLKERAVSFSSGFSGPWDDSVRRPASSLLPTTHFASSQESTVRGRHSSPRTSGQSRSGPREFGEDASERTAFSAIHPYSLSLHHHRYVDCAVGAACTASGGVAHAAQPVSLAHAHNSTRLRDSVRQATSQVQRRSRDVGGSPERPCLARGDCCPPVNDAIEPVPPAEMRQGFYSPYFIVPKKGGGLRPILDLRVLNRALHKLPFKMLTHRRMIKFIQPQDWFAAIDLKDAYFHRFYSLRSMVGHGSTGSSPSGSPCLPVCSRRL